MIANRLGGDGSARGNLVTITDGSNSPHMRGVEDNVYHEIHGGRMARVRVEALYSGNEAIPHTIHYQAWDVRTGERFVNERIPNGTIRPGNTCCPR
jgi:hypothetical protein